MGNVTFRRIGGRIVPIKSGEAKGPKSNTALRIAAAATSVASGVISARSLFSSPKHFFVGQTTSLGLDVVSAGLNVSAHTGKGHAKKRLQRIASDEAINQALGWGTFAAVAAADPRARAAARAFGSKGVTVIKKLLKLGV